MASTRRVSQQPPPSSCPPVSPGKEKGREWVLFTHSEFLFHFLMNLLTFLITDSTHLHPTSCLARNEPNWPPPTSLVHDRPPLRPPLPSFAQNEHDHAHRLPPLLVSSNTTHPPPPLLETSMIAPTHHLSCSFRATPPTHHLLCSKRA